MVQKRYDKEFKSDAVELLLNSVKPLKPLAGELGVTDTTLRAWREAILKARTKFKPETLARRKALNLGGWKGPNLYPSTGCNLSQMF